MGKKILIVEDEQNIVDILSFNLGRDGYDTLEAYDGITGLKLALEENPAVGRLDLSLLSEVKRNEKGMVEVKLIDRLKVLQQLADVMEGSDHQAEAFLRSLAPEQEQL